MLKLKHNKIPVSLYDMLPPNRLAAERILEFLCLKPGEAALESQKHYTLVKYINETYSRLMDKLPTLNDVISCLENALPEDKAITDDLLKRLAKF